MPTSTSTPDLLNRALVRALVGEHEALYQLSPFFHAAIDSLAMMLPSMVKGLVADARERDAFIKEMVAQLEKGPVGGYPPFALDRPPLGDNDG